MKTEKRTAQTEQLLENQAGSEQGEGAKSENDHSSTSGVSPIRACCEMMLLILCCSTCFCCGGNVWTASCHVITAVIGSGMLSLAWSMAQLGWVVGPVVIIGFSVVTYYTSLLLADYYCSPDPVTGQRNYTYKDAVKANLGGAQVILCGFIQYINLLGTTIGYTITASISLVAIGRSNCFHEKGRDAPCHISNNLYMAIFGLAQIIFSQIPNLHKVWWLSIVAVVMSVSYSVIGLGLPIGKATGK
eukprot:PITA_26656